MSNITTFMQCNWCGLQRDAPHPDHLCAECREMFEGMDRSLDKAIAGLAAEYKKLTGDDVEVVLAKEKAERERGLWPRIKKLFLK